jgi:hypothetical protein
MRFETTGGLNQGRPVVRLLEEITLQGVAIPAGFETDFASVPWPLRPFGRAYKASVLHDYLCATGVKRTTRSTLFLRQMREDRIPNWQYRLLYLAVRWWPFGEKDGGLPIEVLTQQTQTTH